MLEASLSKCRIASQLCLCFGIFGLFVSLGHPCCAQQSSDRATLHSSIGDDGTGTIVVEARGRLPEPPVLYTAVAKASVQVGTERVDQVAALSIKVIQGKAQTLSIGIKGKGEVTEVRGENVRSWAVRRQGSDRFLDLHVAEGVTEWMGEIVIRSPTLKLPATIELTHLTPGGSVGFESTVQIEYAPGVVATIETASGFAPLRAGPLVAGEQADRNQANRFQTSTGGQITLRLNRDTASPAAVEWSDSTLKGDLNADGNSIRFRFQATAHVNEPGAEITILQGDAAVSETPADPHFRLRLSTQNGRMVYRLLFDKVGTFPVAFDFVATVLTPGVNRRGLNFTIAAAAVVPLSLGGLDADLEFHRDQESVVPVRDGEMWLGFLPATGRAKLQWKAARQAGKGKLFFTTDGRVEARVGAGLLRQDHQLDFQVLQGELQSLRIGLLGPGEILDVSGSNLVAWKVSGEGEARQLEVTLSQPVVGRARIDVFSQTPLGAFPLRVEGLRLDPVDAIRHSGYIRLTNSGSVRIEPTGLVGLTQLSPDQFPGETIDARQVFVFRFPASEHTFTVAADRVQPEVNVAAMLLYEVSETDRLMKADIELDVREAAIREWDSEIPSDYSVVSVTGAGVADYVLASAVTGGRRNLKVIFAQDMIGRQLVSLHLEKSEVSSDGDWNLPQIGYPGAKTVRGDIGIVGVPGFRVTVGATDLLVEKPLSYFPKQTENLQHAFRIRQRNWSATMRIERLPQSIQSDVFHLCSLSEQTVYGSALINYFVTGAPVSEWKILAAPTLGNVTVDGQNIRTWRREGDMLIVSLHQPVMGAYTLLVSFEERPDADKGSFRAGQITPIDVQGERGYIQIVSPVQVEIDTESISDDLLELDPLELPAELRLLSTAPPLGTWQYTERPFDLNLNVNWFQPGTMVDQVVEFCEANSRVSPDGELVTDVVYFVKSRGRRSFRIKLPAAPVRLWEVSVDGRPVTARKADEVTLIPLPGATDPNTPVEVSLRLGKPTVDESNLVLTLPIVEAPILKAQWNVAGDEQRVLVPDGGTVTPPIPVLRPSGFDWVARRGILSLLLIGLFSGAGVWGWRQSGSMGVVGLCSLAVAIAISAATASAALSQSGAPSPLRLSLPILSAGDTVELQIKNTPLWRVNASGFGLTTLLSGIAAIVWSLTEQGKRSLWLLRCVGIFLIALGVLAQGDGAPWFFGLLALVLLMVLFIPAVIDSIGRWQNGARRRAEQHDQKPGVQNSAGGEIGSATSMLLLIALMLSSAPTGVAAVPDGFRAADSISQRWQLTRRDNRLSASGTIKLSGQPGDRFVLLRAPAVLTRFEGNGLRLTKSDVPGHGLMYVLSIPRAEQAPAPDEFSEQAFATADFKASFEFQLEAVDRIAGLAVLTGAAAVQEITLHYDEAGWDVWSPTAVHVESRDLDGATQAKVLLRPGDATLFLKPQARDVTTEKTQFFVEASNLYVPGPGVVDGSHRLRVRPSQGQLRELSVMVPDGLTVSTVDGPIGSWQFDADSGALTLAIEPAQSQAFDVMIETQRGLDPLPIDVNLAPLTVAGAGGQVGLVAIAFGPDAGPEQAEPKGMSTVNVGDFDAGLIADKKVVLHRVYRYGAEGGELALRVAPVDSEVRISSTQVLSLGDLRVVLGVNFVAEISRAGLFQLSFLLPDGMEVESLSGAALQHWAEMTEGANRRVILHLSGKTIGTQEFSLTLSGAAPTDVGQWAIPRFEIREASRQTGELVVRPTTGIRLRTVSRQNVSETDPRTMGGNAQGALAYRLLQRDWRLVLGIEKLDPWVTGQVLHQATLREGQTRSALIARFTVQNASLDALRVVLPITDADEMKTLRATGDTVSDFVRAAPDSNVWEVRFKRRVFGRIEFRIEYERRGDRVDDRETLSPAGFPQARQLSYYLAVRAGGRLELEPEGPPKAWQRVDWGSVPPPLREAENRNAPAFTFRAIAPEDSISIRAIRHSLADALKLRVAEGSLTTVLSPTGDQLTSVDVSVDVIQRSSLSVGLPVSGELFSVFVNGESVNTIRRGGTVNAWQFYILPGIDDRTAHVRFVYSLSGDRLKDLKLISPELNVPLENIRWNVIAPEGFELVDHDGSLELVRHTNQALYDRGSYLSKVGKKRNVQAKQAAELLEQANRLLQAGQQSKARWALNSVANQYALDAASNEDARVQLQTLQTQQAIVGLNTRRQRLYLDNRTNNAAVIDNQQLREAAADNPILQQDQLNFRPQQLSQLLRGNTPEDNANLQRIADRLVHHQRATEPAPQAILISLPEEGSVYTFSRSVQVAENAPLELDLEFRKLLQLPLWQTASLVILLGAMAATLAWFASRRKSEPAELGGSIEPGEDAPR
jgi:hypothetical protein